MQPDSEFLFVGTGREMENRLIPAEGYEIKNIKMSGFARGVKPKDFKHNLTTIHNLAESRKDSERIIDEFKPDAVIGTGGYVCYPVLKCAAKHGIPTFMHESNAIPGLTTKMLSGVVDKVMVAFPEVSSYYKKPENVVVTGTPVRGDFLPISRKEAKSRLGVSGKPLVVSFWGSLGADGMNHKMADFIRLNSKSGAMWHIHATGNGENGVSRMIERLSECGVYGLPEWEDLRPYIDNMGLVMTAADIVICRAGASTLAEITKVGRASILVPSPNVTNNHQEKNARHLEKEGGAIVVTEDNSSGEQLYNTVIGLLREPNRLAQLEKNAAKLGEPEATKKIVDVILSNIN
jgi:UDP-N-acetylglucosamine--N-acetylmuramyl-(pentapeptide) pyrophosphoryl-undecaprenol N-acetylglucosamine transferase